MNRRKDTKEISFFYRLPPAKLVTCFAAGALMFFLFPLKHADSLSRIMLAWDTFSFCLLSIYWFIFYTTPAIHIRQMAAKEDSGRLVIFIITLICTSASMLAVLLLLTTKNDTPSLKAIHLAVAVSGMIFSWSLVHTIFSVRYAHLFYADHKSHANTQAGGLDFPDESKPDFVDFAYFSFVLGMTFQVSDVSISSRKIRRMVLWHSLISFGYNAVIIALTINVVAGLGE